MLLIDARFEATQGISSFRKPCPCCNHRSGQHFNNVTTTIDLAGTSTFTSCINLNDAMATANSIDLTADDASSTVEYNDDIEMTGNIYLKQNKI